jgi:hypothetical protein
VTLTFYSTTAMTAAIELLIDSNTTTHSATPYFHTPTTATTLATMSSTDLVVDVTPSASGDSITLLGGYTEKVR